MVSIGFGVQSEAGTITSPRMSRRAVRSSAARITVCVFAGSSSSSTLNSPVGCSTETSSPTGATRAMPVGHRSVEHGRGRDGDRREHADGVVDDVRDEAAGGEAAAPRVAARRGTSSGRSSRTTSPSPIMCAGLESQRLDAGLQLGVGVEVGHRFVASAADVDRAEQHHRHAIVDARDPKGAHAVDGTLVGHPTGRQQARRHRTGGVEEVDRIGADVPGTPSIRALPSYVTGRPGSQR